MSKWFYLVQGQQEGPISQEELLQKLTSGELPESTFIWSKGMQDWLKASDAASFLTSPPPPVPPAEQPAAPAKARLSLTKKDPAAEAAAQPESQAAPSTVTASVIGQRQFQMPTQSEAAYLYISPFRLIFMSVLSFGLYELYWIYKNWKYAKDRDGLDIMPFWRAWWGIFHCHNLLRYIHTDRILTRWREPSFKPGLLATVWVIMKIIENITLRAGGDEITSTVLLGPLWPSFLCFLPVQIYINRVNKEMAPDARKTGFTLGHIVITLFSLIVWAGLTAALFFPEQFTTQ